MRIKVVLVDDHRLFREGVRKLLEQQGSMTVVGEAEDGRAGVALVRELDPDVVILDVGMRSMNGIEACRAMRRERPGLKVIALSMLDDPRLVREMLRAGASGYLLKDCAVEDLVSAVKLVFEKNQMSLSPGVSRGVVEGYLDPLRSQGASDDQALTAREREVLQLVAEGRTSQQAADTLGVSVKTVEKHRSNIARKLGMGSLADLVKYAVREGLTPP